MIQRLAWDLNLLEYGLIMYHIDIPTRYMLLQVWLTISVNMAGHNEYIDRRDWTGMLGLGVNSDCLKE